MLESFAALEVPTTDTRIFVRMHGSGPPLLLLHGFPQTHLMWRDVAPLLAEHFTVVCADLRGYGASGCPPSAPDHAPYAKRALAQDMVEVMRHLGHARFLLAGHDRGARVAYRLALDHPHCVQRLAVLDALPVDTVWSHADERFALAYWPWTLLAQAPPLPESVLSASAHAVVDHALSAWGTPATVFPRDVRRAYARVLRDPAHAHAICEEYRAAATIDRAHDQADRSVWRRIVCPLLVLWSAGGPLGTWYAAQSGPLSIWRQWGDDVQGHGVPAGHFFPEEDPRGAAAVLQRFFAVG